VRDASELVTAEERSFRWGHRGEVLRLQAPADLVGRIERSLFESNLITVRCSTESQADFVAASGLLAVLATHSNNDSLSVSVGGKEAIVEGGSPERKVDVVHRLLTEAGIFTRPQKSGAQ